MDVAAAVKECHRIQRELRRLKFQMPPEERKFVAALERVCQALGARLGELKPK